MHHQASIGLKAEVQPRSVPRSGSSVPFCSQNAHQLPLLGLEVEPEAEPEPEPEVDRALQRAPRNLELLRQAPDDVSALEGTVAAMRDLTSA